jgi:hypothetical protein
MHAKAKQHAYKTTCMQNNMHAKQLAKQLVTCKIIIITNKKKLKKKQQ